MLELNDEALYWLRELCVQGRFANWPPEHIIEELVAKGFLLRRYGAIGATSEGRAAAALI